MGDSALHTLADLLNEAKLEHLQISSTLGSLDALYTQGRQPLLLGLQGFGAAKLADRQHLANTLGKAKRAGRVVPTDGSEIPVGGTAGVLPSLPPKLAAEPQAMRYGPQPTRRLRILCLHSFRTNSKILKAQMALSQQQALLAPLADLDFLDAPYSCNAEDEKKQYEAILRFFPSGTYGAYREWYNARVENGVTGDGFVVYDRFNESIRCVQQKLQEAKPPYGSGAES